MPPVTKSPALNSSRQTRPRMGVDFAVGLILLGSGLFHVFVWIIDGGSWSGDVSWRKPILFGFSAGATVLSVSWVSSKLRPRWGDSLVLVGFSLAMFAEVALITLQQWRGVPSHFNRSTAYDASILMWIEGLILFVTIVIADVTWRSFSALDASRDMALAIRAGMAFLLFGCLLGFVLVGYGAYQQSLGQPPGVFGKAGVMKFPHGMPIHAIQFFPMLVWGQRSLKVTEAVRYHDVRFAFWSMSAFTLFSLMQTFSGRARFDLSASSTVVLALASALLIVPFCTLVLAVLPKRRGGLSV